MNRPDVSHQKRCGVFPSLLNPVVIALGMCIFSVNSAKAQVFVNFVESGMDTTATISGSFKTSVTGVEKRTRPSAIGSTWFYTDPSSGINAYTLEKAGKAETISIASAFGSSAPGAFGFNGDVLTWDKSYGATLFAGTQLSGSTTFTDKSITDLFGSAPSGPILAWTMDNATADDKITYTFDQVPEPSSLVMLIMTAGFVTMKRSRKKANNSC